MMHVEIERERVIRCTQPIPFCPSLPRIFSYHPSLHISFAAQYHQSGLHLWPKCLSNILIYQFPCPPAISSSPFTLLDGNHRARFQVPLPIEGDARSQHITSRTDNERKMHLMAGKTMLLDETRKQKAILRAYMLQLIILHLPLPLL